MALQRFGAAPLYQQLRRQLAAAIAAGRWPRGSQMPTELELTELFGVSRATVRKALELMEKDGEIYRRKGRGTFVGRPEINDETASLLRPWNLRANEFSPPPDARFNRTPPAACPMLDASGSGSHAE